MCGIVGYTGAVPVNIDKFKLACIFSRSRGKDSSGIFLNGHIHKEAGYSTNDHPDPINFFQNTEIILPKHLKTNVAMFHARSATIGLRNLKNAHPFEYFTDDGVRHVFMHNGTLKEISTLAKKYDIDEKLFDVDSELLGHIIVHHGFDVLNHYKGAAAFMYWRSDENALYLFKGASIQNYDKKVVEERPLLFFENSNGIYFGSERLILAPAIGVPADTIIDMVPNTLYKYINKKLISTEIYDRSQIDSYIIPLPVNVYPDYNSYKRESSKEEKYIPEPNVQNASGGKVYFWRSRMWKNGHLLEGHFKLLNDGTFDKNGQDYYFYRGILIKDKESYDNLKSNNYHCTKDNTPSIVKWAMHPRMMLIETIGRYLYVYCGSGQPATMKKHEDFLPLFSRYTYHINNYGNSITYSIQGLLPLYKETDHQLELTNFINQ